MWLGRATLDAIGLAGEILLVFKKKIRCSLVREGFGYHFNSLTDDNNELAHAFGVIFSTARKFRVMTILQVWFPFLRRFVSTPLPFSPFPRRLVIVKTIIWPSSPRSPSIRLVWMSRLGSVALAFNYYSSCLARLISAFFSAPE
jgi:hypothetical protein